MKGILDSIQVMVPASLGETERVSLMNRNETKYVFHAALLPGILEQAQTDYRILTIGSRRLFSYKNLYYDTDGLDFYRSHHNRVRPRYKVRFREYSDTETVFLEIKCKTNKDLTKKSRMEAEGFETTLSGGSRRFIGQQIPVNPDALNPALWVFFKRMTLGSENSNERITIDFDLEFALEHNKKSLPGLVICEVKRDPYYSSSPFMRLLKQQRIYPGRMSKYCYGTILMKNNIKTNRFRADYLRINRLKNDNESFTAAV